MSNIYNPLSCHSICHFTNTFIFFAVSSDRQAYLSILCCTIISSHPTSTSKHKPHLFKGHLLSGENGNAMGVTDDLRMTDTWNFHTVSIHISHEQGNTYPRHQGSWTTKLCMLAHNICGSSILNLLLSCWHITFVGPQYWTWFISSLGAHNSVVDPRLLENLLTPAHKYLICLN
jgi:hypothetical protein